MVFGLCHPWALASVDSHWSLLHVRIGVRGVVQADAVDKMSLVRALKQRGISASLESRRWVHVDLIRHWAVTFLPPEARFMREAEATWLREVEEMGG